MTPSTRHTAELALIYSIPYLSGNMKPCRTKGLFDALQKWAAHDLGNIPKLTNPELDRILARILTWGKETGWLNNKKHNATTLSFCADIIEKSEFDFHPRIIETINDLIAHFENGNDLKIQNCWTGSLAAEKWEKLFKEEIA